MPLNKLAAFGLAAAVAAVATFAFAEDVVITPDPSLGLIALFEISLNLDCSIEPPLQVFGE